MSDFSRTSRRWFFLAIASAIVNVILVWLVIELAPRTTPVRRICASRNKAVLTEIVKDGTFLRAVPLSSDNRYESGWVFPIHWATAAANPIAIQIFLDAGVDPNTLSSAGESPIHWLVGNGATSEGNSLDSARVCLDILIAAGADINQGQTRENPGYTALHFAAWLLEPDDVEMLCQYGANIELRDVAGNTPLHVAAAVETGAAERPLWEATIKAIVNNGADVSLQNNAGERAIDVVARVNKAFEVESEIGSLLTPR